MSLYDNQYLPIVEKVLNNGVYGENRTQFNTFKLPQQEMRFDLSEEFPILTSKQVFSKSYTDEILWIWQRQSNNVNDLNSKIWNEWADESGSIGKAYGYQIAPTDRIFKVVKVKKRNNHKVETELNYPIFKIKEKSFDETQKDLAFSNQFKNRDGLSLNIINIVEEADSIIDSVVDIQFEYTGYIKKNVKFSDISDISDVYYPSIQGKGFLGERDYKNIDSDMERYLYSTWIYILRNTKKTLDARWLNFTNFVRDARYLPNWSAKKIKPLEYVLDTNYYCTDIYSKDTCVWLHQADYALYKDTLPIKVTNRITGTTAIELSMYVCIDKYATSLEDIKTELLNRQEIDEASNQKRQGKYSFEYMRDEEDFVYRYKLPVNQVNKLIETLKNDSQSRRMIVTLWNVEELEDMNLEPCAFQTIWDVTGDKLNLTLIQRSADFLIGVPFNTSQYAVLCHLIAQVTGHKPGQFVHFMNNCHIYENQIPGGKVQLSNPTFDAPKLWINPEIKDFYDFTVDDIKLIDYKHAGKVDMGEIAV